MSWSGTNSLYNVYRSVASGGPYTLVAPTLTNTNYIDTSVTNGIPYFYVVTGLNILGQESANSTEVNVSPVSLSSPQLNVVSQNNAIQFAWPSDHVGWRLLINTNGLANTNGWLTVSNSAMTNQIWIPLNPAQNNAFFRLVYP